MSGEKSQEKGGNDRPPASRDSEKETRQKAVDPEVLRKLPPEARALVEFSMTRVGPMPNPIYDKLTPQHISTILELSGKDDERKFKDNQSARWFHLAYVIIGVLLLSFLTWFLVPQNSQLYLDIVEKIVLVGVGLGGGYGIKSYQDWKREQ